MKDKIFQSLKTKYSKLGLGDKVLDAHATMLAGLNIVTDENLEQVVTGQDIALREFQKVADQERTARATAERERQALEERLKGSGGTPPAPNVLSSEDIAALVQAELDKHVKPLKQQLAEKEAAEARMARAQKITTKAKELGVPEWRIKEGFVIADDADDTAIEGVLKGVKQNIVTAGLEEKSAFPLATAQSVIDDDAKAFVSRLPDKN